MIGRGFGTITFFYCLFYFLFCSNKNYPFIKKLNYTKKCNKSLFFSYTLFDKCPNVVFVKIYMYVYVLLYMSQCVCVCVFGDYLKSSSSRNSKSLSSDESKVVDKTLLGGITIGPPAEPLVPKTFCTKPDTRAGISLELLLSKA